MPEYFDILTSSTAESKNTKNKVIADILKKHSVKTVLDMTCGTGSQVLWLKKDGFDVTGSDFSPKLLEIARKKAQQEKLKIKFIDGDMRTLQVGQFDGVITIDNAVGHLTKAGFAKAIKNIAKNIKLGGVYVFDIFNSLAMDDKTVDNLALDYTKTIDGTKIHAVQFSKINREKGQLTSFDRFVFQKGSDKPLTIKSKFTLQIYTAKELREMLVRNGFETHGQYAIDGSEFIPEKTLNILTVARKI